MAQFYTPDKNVSSGIVRFFFYCESKKRNRIKNPQKPSYVSDIRNKF